MDDLNRSSERDGSTESDDDDDETATFPPGLIFDNPLAMLILQRDWEGALLHLTSSDGRMEATQPAYATRHDTYYPIHLVYVSHDVLPRVLQVFVLDKGRSSLRDNKQVNINNSKWELLKQLSLLHPDALLIPMPGGGGLIPWNAIQENIDPDIVRTMLEANPDILMKRFRSREDLNKGRLLIHDIVSQIIPYGLLLYTSRYKSYDYFKIVIKMRPQCLLERTGNNRTVLDLALSSSSKAIVSDIIEKCPELVFAPVRLSKNENDVAFVLHRFCKEDWPVSDIKKVLSIYPSAVSVKSRTNMRYPIHIFCCRLFYQHFNRNLTSEDKECFALLQEMITTFPECLIEIDNEGNLPLHIHTSLLDFFHRSTDPSKNGPRRVSQQAQIMLLDETFEVLVKRSGTASSDLHKKKMNILHKATMMAHLFFPFRDFECHELETFIKGAIVEMNKMFRTTNIKTTNAVEEETCCGNTFIHLLWNTMGKQKIAQKHWLDRQNNDEMWQNMLNKKQSGMNVRRRRLENRLNLFSANKKPFSLSKRQNFELPSMLQCVINVINNNPTFQERYPLSILDMIQHTNDDGELPLHRALRYGRSCHSTEADINLLLKLYPNGVTIANAQGELPLHVALKNQCPTFVLKCVTLLLHGNPSALTIKDQETKLFPFMLCAIKRPFEDITNGALACLQSTYDFLQSSPGVIEAI